MCVLLSVSCFPCAINWSLSALILIFSLGIATVDFTMVHVNMYDIADACFVDLSERVHYA